MCKNLTHNGEHLRFNRGTQKKRKKKKKIGGILIDTVRGEDDRLDVKVSEFPEAFQLAFL